MRSMFIAGMLFLILLQIPLIALNIAIGAGYLVLVNVATMVISFMAIGKAA